MITELQFFRHKGWRFARRIEFLHLLRIGNDLKLLLLMTSLSSSLGQPSNLSQMFHLSFNMSLALVLLNAFKSTVINSCTVRSRNQILLTVRCAMLLLVTS